MALLLVCRVHGNGCLNAGLPNDVGGGGCSMQLDQMGFHRARTDTLCLGIAANKN